MMIAGCGALNLDIIFEIEDMEPIVKAGFPLSPGRECVLNHEEAKELLALLDSEASLMGKSGGGSAANTICALTKMGHSCYFIGSVGDDEEGQYLLDAMKGVDCTLVTRFGKSSMCIIVVDRVSNDRALAVVPGDLAIDPEHPKIQMVLQNARILHISSLAQEKGLEVQRGLASSKGPECLLSFDPGEIYAKRGMEKLAGLLDLTGLLFSSDQEFSSIFHGMSVMEVISKKLFGKNAQGKLLKESSFFKKMPAPVLAKKSGSRGALLASKANVIHCPAKKVENVVDNTGAGDAFNAGLIDAISKGMDPQDALKNAVSLAAFSLGFPGRDWIEHLDAIRPTH